MVEFSLSHGHLPVAFTVNYHCAICECVRNAYYTRYNAGKKKLESYSVMVAAFVLAVEQGIGDVFVEPDTIR